MKRDDDLIRQLLFEAEARPDGVVLFEGMVLIAPSEEAAKRAHHAKLLEDAGYFAQVSKAGFRLTNSGHDWLQAVRDDTIWSRTKEAAGKAGGVGLSVMGSIAMGYVKQKLTEQGIPFG